MSAKTGLNVAGTKRWYSVKITGNVAKIEKFINAFLMSHYGTAFNYETMTPEQKCVLLDESLVNDMISRVALHTQTAVKTLHAADEQQWLTTALSDVEITGVD